MTTPLIRLALATVVLGAAFPTTSIAQRGRGGMVGGRAPSGGGGGGGGGGARQNFSRPSPSVNISRPSGNPNVGRPIGNENINRGNINRPVVNENINRPNINQNINRPNINNNNVTNNIVRQNNVNVYNRPGNVNVNNYNHAGWGYGGYGGYGGGYRGWGGPGGYGNAYHAPYYYGYHSNWVNGSWGGGFVPGWGGYPGYYPGYYGYNNIGTTALGIGAGIGIAAWGIGSLTNSWGYSPYSNPYYSNVATGFLPASGIGQQVAYDYSRPLDLSSTPPPEAVVQESAASLDTARQAFQAGDYNRGLALADQALSRTPNDPILHEFRAVCLFALRRYDEAAVPLYTVLSVGPGWDWTTLIGLYPDVEIYTSQLRALEAYCNATPRAASARFVLAALYLTQGSNAAAAGRLKQVVALQPQDRLSAQLLASLSSDPQPNATASTPAEPTRPPPTNPAGSTPPEGPKLPTAPVPANLVGAWTASPTKDVVISLTINDDGKSFTWKVTEKGQPRSFQGESSFEGDLIALVPPDMPPMVGNVTVKDATHFHFKAAGTPNDDPGLDFSK